MGAHSSLLYIPRPLHCLPSLLSFLHVLFVVLVFHLLKNLCTLLSKISVPRVNNGSVAFKIGTPENVNTVVGDKLR